MPADILFSIAWRTVAFDGAHKHIFHCQVQIVDSEGFRRRLHITYGADQEAKFFVTSY